MKKILVLSFLCLGCLPLAVQAADKPEPAAAPPAQPASHLTTFDLDFPGGTPRELIAAIQKASGHSLNAVIPDEIAGFKLPPLKMAHVTAAALFQALQRAVVQMPRGNQIFQYGATFGTSDSPDRQTDDTIWTFTVNGQTKAPGVTKFYLLTPYLEGGLTVDDITTAVQTAWRMSGVTPTPALSFHKETQLLIASGDGYSLETIDSVLRALDPKKAMPKNAPRIAAPDKPAAN